MKIFRIVLISTLFCFLLSCSVPVQRMKSGPVFGTSYNISYECGMDLSQGIDSCLHSVDSSLSMFNKKSIISKINRNESDFADSLFVKLFVVAKRINAETDGAFDITVAPLVNAWGFGYKHDALPDSIQVDSLLDLIGMSKVRLEGRRIIKNNPKLQLDASSIAKGLGVDVVSEFFERKGVRNYMVEIGGEVRALGKNSKGQTWRIGIDKPIYDVTVSERELQEIINISNGSLATSGNYRNFFVKDGKRYGHTINPRTGYPVQTDVLSVSVYANNCMEADAYATAFMVLGSEKAMKIVNNNPNIEAYFICSDGNDKIKVLMSDGFTSLISTTN